MNGWQGCDDDNHISFINIISDGNLKGNSVMSVLLFQGNQFTGTVYVWYTLNLNFFVVHILSLEEQKPFYERIIREMGNNEGLFFFFTLLCCELIMSGDVLFIVVVYNMQNIIAFNCCTNIYILYILFSQAPPQDL